MRLDRRAMMAGLAATALAPKGALASRSAVDAAAMRAAAVSFLEAQDGDAAFGFNDPLRTAWHWFPQRFYSRREGVQLNAMSAEARDAALALLEASTMPDGADKAKAIMRLQEKLGRDAGDFHVSVYGDPSPSGRWGWSLEGHHLSLNYTLNGDRIAAGPLFLGARPTRAPEWRGVAGAPMAVEEDAARAVLTSLDRPKFERALFADRTPGDTITRSATQVEPLPPVGLPLSELSAAQRDRTLEVVRAYLSVMPPQLAAARFDEIAGTPDDQLSFGWAGAARDGLYYYRIAGPGWFIEHDNSRDAATHIHSVWREIAGDFGRAL